MHYVNGYAQIKEPKDAVRNEHGFVVEGTLVEPDMATWQGRMYKASIPLTLKKQRLLDNMDSQFLKVIQE